MEEETVEETTTHVGATKDRVQTASSFEKRNFICGVIEGFYGRPWTTEQRKDLFRKLKKWGMDSYVYAPKDDYKHRAYWRELYTVEEAEFLASLIKDAKEHGVTFYYALSPGLDMSYSNQKEIQTLKRKLDQVGQFGCEGFALLFDDIEAELSKTDKEVFQTFANAQVSVTNEIYAHLRRPKFLFCPTQYCSTRAVPTVQNSEYLNTLGSKLNQGIDIMWTGDKVISKVLTIESIQVITEILRRPPVIWDNLHANDYDQKRVFLGPYCGRTPELIPHLRGVMTNPNCEFHANTIAIYTLAYWSQCSLDSKMNSVLADIKLETEDDDDAVSTDDMTDNFCMPSKKIYHPRIALKNAISEWLPEFSIEKEAWGPITKPQPQVAMVMPIIPIIPSINTCMSLTTTTTTTSCSLKTVTLPEVNSPQLQALAEVCSTVDSSAVNPISNPVMNSLISPTKVVTNDDILNPITTTVTSNIELPIPISIVQSIMHSKTLGETPNNVLLNHDIRVHVAKPDAIKTTETVGKIGAKDTPAEDGDHDSDGHCRNIVEDDIVLEEKPVGATGAATILDTNNISPLSVGGNEECMECSSSAASQASPKEERKAASEDIVMAEANSVHDPINSMQVESSTSPMEEMKEDEETAEEAKSVAAAAVAKRAAHAQKSKAHINADDLHLLCDLFYLPFEHGSRGRKLLSEFNWLKANANVLLCDRDRPGAFAAESQCAGDVPANAHADASNDKEEKPTAGGQQEQQPTAPEVAEWLQRAESFYTLCNAVHELLKKMANCANKEICHDLFSYVWDMCGTLTLLNAFVRWLSLGRFPQNMYTFTQGTYTWFSKGWKEAFMSGDQEPWVFRGGLIADLQRLMPIDGGNDLFLYKLPDLPTTDYYLLRPYKADDEQAVGAVTTQVFLQNLCALGKDESHEDHSAPSKCVEELVADRMIGPFITLNPHLCIVAHDKANTIVGYAAAALDVNVFARNTGVCWMPAMCEKYALTLTDDLASTMFATSCPKLGDTLCEMIKDFHNYSYECPLEVSAPYLAVLKISVLSNTSDHHGIDKRLLTVMLAMLRANGCFGVHIRLPVKRAAEQLQYYSKFGFTEVYRDTVTNYMYVGRRF